ncbi:OPT oligopeptide transporter protein [Ceratobasidium sp. AG-Ba]|nr:OPT oligopeptide transporter protein [Ceratobasidium sp. AG-Ba]
MSHQPEGIVAEGSRHASPVVTPTDEKVPGYDEKRGDFGGERVHDSDHDHDMFGDDKLDPHEPFPIDPMYEEEEYQLTLRALVVGWVLGAVVGASNIYLGLKTGFTFGPQLFGAIFGFAILKPLSKAFTLNFLPGWVWGGEFGPKENCTVQTAATSAGGMGIIFVSAVPAMYRLELLSELPSSDVGKLLALTVSAAFFGVFFAIPLRKYYILKEKLMFPTPTATAFTIRALHAGRTGAEVARKKSIGLASSFAGAFCFKVASGYLPGVIWDWHIGWTFYRLGWTSMIQLDNYGWWLEFTPAFFGAGMLSGMNASWSFFGGFVLAWGIIAPSIIHTGVAVGKQRAPDEFPEVLSFQSMSANPIELFITAPSPRYWLLWPGVLIMLVYSFAELAMSSRGMFSNLGGVGSGIMNSWRRWRTRGDPNVIHAEDDNDPTKPEDRVPAWAWMTGLAGSLVLSCALLATQFSLNVGEAFVLLVLGFLFSFIGVQSSGYTDINPVSTVAKASQLIFGGVTKGAGTQLKPAQEINLVAGIIAAGSAAQACDMTGDLKTGHLLRAKPKNQFVAQITGSIVSVFLGVGLFVLFTKASPCILYLPEDGICSYSAPSVSAWAAVATAVTAPKLPVPPTSGYTAIGLSIAAVITCVVKHLWIPRKYWVYVPNWNAIGLAFVVPQTYYGTAMAAGATFNYIWERRNIRSFDMYMFPISAGLLAGEGLGGVLLALLSVAGVGADGVKYGTSVGCTINEFCG